jgi:NodT family efflux transporter outer membrane factor (OMF) lipoprotein
MHRRGLLALLNCSLALMCSACSQWRSLPLWSSGYQQPEAPSLTAWEGGERVTQVPAVAESTPAAQDGTAQDTALAPVVLSQWWELFNSDALNSLTQRLLTRNWSLQEAYARLLEVQAVRSIRAADFYPQLELGAGFARGRLTSSQFGTDGGAAEGFTTTTGATSNRYQALGSLAWEIDLFGGTRRAYEAAVAEVQAEAESLSATRLALVAALAEQYVLLLSRQQAILIAERNAELQRESLALVSARYSAGLTTELDQAQASAQLESTLATLPGLRSQREEVITSILNLIAPTTEELPTVRAELRTLSATPLPPLPTELYGPQPAELVRARPDIRKAERLLAASTARSAEAVAEYFPRLTLGARLGYRNESSNDLFSSENEFWDLAPAISWPLFTAGRLGAQVEVREAQLQQQYTRYQASVLQALSEAQTALFQLHEARARKAALERSVSAQRRAHLLAREQYEQGLVDFQVVLDAELRVFIFEQSQLEAQQNELQRFIFVMKALGAGALEQAR